MIWGAAPSGDSITPVLFDWLTNRRSYMTRGGLEIEVLIPELDGAQGFYTMDLP